jgi:arginine-tRNA-protein transferase
MGVLDILPKCVSSVYFMYDKAMERFSLGKVRLVSLSHIRFNANAIFL